MTYQRINEDTGQHAAAMTEHADKVERVVALINEFASLNDRVVVVEVFEAALAIWLTGSFGVQGSLLAATLLLDGEIATDLLADYDHKVVA